MFRIRDFSRFTRVSVKMLRRYDRLGLLPPARVDPRTRYRYYSARQLVTLQRIVAMRDLGFSLDEVAELLARHPQRDGLRRRLRAKREEVERRLEAERERLGALERRLRDLEQGRRPLPDVVLRELPAVRAATQRARVPSLDAGAGSLFEAVESAVAAARLRAAGPPLLIYHDRDYREEEADVEVAVPVVAEAPLGALGRGREARVRVLPRIARAACLVYDGTYDQLAEALAGVLAALDARRLTASGPWREAYLRFHPGRAAQFGLPPAFLAESADQLVTEIQVPVAPAAGRSPRSQPGRNRAAAR